MTGPVRGVLTKRIWFGERTTHYTQSLNKQKTIRKETHLKWDHKAHKTRSTQLNHKYIRAEQKVHDRALVRTLPRKKRPTECVEQRVNINLIIQHEWQRRTPHPQHFHCLSYWSNMIIIVIRCDGTAKNQTKCGMKNTKSTCDRASSDDNHIIIAKVIAWTRTMKIALVLCVRFWRVDCGVKWSVEDQTIIIITMIRLAASLENE